VIQHIDNNINHSAPVQSSRALQPQIKPLFNYSPAEIKSPSPATRFNSTHGMPRASDSRHHKRRKISPHFTTRTTSSSHFTQSYCAPRATHHEPRTTHHAPRTTRIHHKNLNSDAVNHRQANIFSTFITGKNSRAKSIRTNPSVHSVAHAILFLRRFIRYTSIGNNCAGNSTDNPSCSRTMLPSISRAA